VQALLLFGLVIENSSDLDNTNHSEEEVDSSEEVVLGLDDEAPTSPDDTGASKGKVLGEGELLGRTSEIGDTGKDKSPLQATNQVSMCAYIVCIDVAVFVGGISRVVIIVNEPS
jgi:hypothetical protein